MYDHELERMENKISTKDKIEPQHTCTVHVWTHFFEKKLMLKCKSHVCWQGVQLLRLMVGELDSG